VTSLTYYHRGHRNQSHFELGHPGFGKEEGGGGTEEPEGEGRRGKRSQEEGPPLPTTTGATQINLILNEGILDLLRRRERESRRSKEGGGRR
jgi:hypothetical protein